MPPRRGEANVIRIVEGVRGRVPMRMELRIRFDYGSTIPWVRRSATGMTAVAGPDALELRTDVDLRGQDFATIAEFAVAAGERVPFTLAWHRSHERAAAPVDPWRAVRQTERYWTEWASRCRYRGRWRDAVIRSLLTLKSLTYAPTGGVVAAPTTSLPEDLGGVRNWDYRFCWLRDATFTLYSLLLAGYEAEARAWRDWLVRAVAGKPSALQIMYGVAGERRLPECEIGWLPGYESSAPVRIGNAATSQFQLDVYGEVVDLLHQAASAGIEHDEDIRRVERSMLDFLEGAWHEPDNGIWEMRGPRRHFTHSKVMAWVAFDRAVRGAEAFGLDGPIERWSGLRDEIHEEVCRQGFDAVRGSFTQFYGSDRLDASLLVIPLVGFLPIEDPRVEGTIAAVRRSLLRDGLVARYENDEEVEGLSGDEGAFLACTFWLVDCLALSGEMREARRLFERVLGLRNDVGLLSEQFDVRRDRMLGNFPQAFSHVSLIDSARNLEPAEPGPARRRGATS
jgi:GH15 family glucan-1,4-alpha-glucosidase